MMCQTTRFDVFKAWQLTCVLREPFHALPGELCQVAVQGELVVQDLIGLDFNVCRLALGSSQGLMDHDPGAGQRIILALRITDQNTAVQL